MPRLEARTRGGEVVACETVEVDLVVEVLRRWMQVLSGDAVILIDGAPLSEADRVRVHGADVVPGPVDVQRMRTCFETMHSAFENVRLAEWETVRTVQSITKGMADEFVRQRDLMHRCLKDCDAVDRSIAATGASDQIQRRMHVAHEGPERGGMTVEDLLHGFSNFLKGLKGGQR